MTQEIMRDIAVILGVSVDSLKQMPEKILGSMQSVLENIQVNNDEDKKILYNDLNECWVKGTVLIGLSDVSKGTGIVYSALENLDFDTQQNVVFEYMADSSNIKRIYTIVNKALSVMEIDDISKLIGVSKNKLDTLSDDMKQHICGVYAMEYEPDGDNSRLIKTLKEIIAL